jgi:hypothetical protein
MLERVTQMDKVAEFYARWFARKPAQEVHGMRTVYPSASIES